MPVVSKTTDIGDCYGLSRNSNPQEALQECPGRASWSSRRRRRAGALCVSDLSYHLDVPRKRKTKLELLLEESLRRLNEGESIRKDALEDPDALADRLRKQDGVHLPDSLADPDTIPEPEEDDDEGWW